MSQFNAAESAELQQRNDNDPPFAGTYRSSWLEDDGPEDMELRISPRTDGPSPIYLLTWRRHQGPEVFYGEAFVFNDILVGNYWDDEVDALSKELRNW